MSDSPDDRSAMAAAMAWSSRITTISMEMVVPGLIGYWIDEQLGTVAIFLVTGVILGFSIGLWQLIKLGQQPETGTDPLGKGESSNDR